MNWDADFMPVTLPDGRKLETLADATNSLFNLANSTSQCWPSKNDAALSRSRLHW